MLICRHSLFSTNLDVSFDTLDTTIRRSMRFRLIGKMTRLKNTTTRFTIKVLHLPFFSDPISALYLCMWNYYQRYYYIDHVKEIPSRVACATRCQDNPDCIAFEYYPTSTLDCYLSKTLWQETQPVSGGGRWMCQKKEGA